MSISLDLKIFYFELTLVVQMPLITVDQKHPVVKVNTLLIFMDSIVSITMSLQDVLDAFLMSDRELKI